jgi:hypothetical protein
MSGSSEKVAGQVSLEEAEEDLLAFYAFPFDHRRKLRATNRSNGSTARSVDAATSSASS